MVKYAVKRENDDQGRKTTRPTPGQVTAVQFHWNSVIKNFKDCRKNKISHATRVQMQ
jgi:hypothetical protein